MTSPLDRIEGRLDEGIFMHPSGEAVARALDELRQLSETGSPMIVQDVKRMAPEDVDAIQGDPMARGVAL